MKILGGILLAIGILIAGASGLCSLAFLSDSSGMGGFLEVLPMILIFGGIPFAMGLAFCFAGAFLIRRNEADGG